MKQHIVKDHGPLLAKYYTYGDGQKQEGDPEHIHGTDLETFNNTSLGKQWGPFEQYDFISEGDSPAFLHLINVGLQNLEHPEYGGWGGRLVPSDSLDDLWEDDNTVADWNPFSDTLDSTFPQTRWIPAIQEDFASRADWCVKPYDEANHPPEVRLSGGTNRKVIPGETIQINPEIIDPDGDSLKLRWWRYAEVDLYEGNVDLPEGSSGSWEFHVPEDFAPGRSIHLILEVTDEAEHPMTRYTRLIVVGDDR
ncbi:MAG: DUF1593 domain-containing protein [Cyclobacteriaceae bacterium]